MGGVISRSCLSKVLRARESDPTGSTQFGWGQIVGELGVNTNEILVLVGAYFMPIPFWIENFRPE